METTSTLATAFSAWPEMDWMGRLDRMSDGVLLLVCRFRLYETPDTVWGMEDKKEWMSGQLPIGTTAEAALAMLLSAQRKVEKLVPLPILVSDSVVQLDGDNEAFIRQMKSKSWCHVKEFKSKEEAARFLKGREPN